MLAFKNLRQENEGFKANLGYISLSQTGKNNHVRLLISVSHLVLGVLEGVVFVFFGFGGCWFWGFTLGQGFPV